MEEFSVNIMAFIDDDGDGHVDYISAERVEWTYDRQGGRIDQRVLDPDLKIPADLVIIAIGFRGPQLAPFKDNDIEITERNTIKTDQRMMTNLPGVFAAGDANRGQSIVVWAIGEGRDVARQIDLFLMAVPSSRQVCGHPIHRSAFELLIAFLGRGRHPSGLKLSQVPDRGPQYDLVRCSRGLESAEPTEEPLVFVY